jgi:hypothetical protein
LEPQYIPDLDFISITVFDIGCLMSDVLDRWVSFGHTTYLDTVIPNK